MLSADGFGDERDEVVRRRGLQAIDHATIFSARASMQGETTRGTWRRSRLSESGFSGLPGGAGQLLEGAAVSS
jgi:hypothetical protein